MAGVCPSPTDLLPALSALQKSVQEAGEEGVSFRKHNARFDKRNETTQLLNAAAEQLWNEKQAMEQTNFEEHASDLPYLCQHFRTAINQGLTESARAEKFTELQIKRRNAGFQVDPKPRRVFCCSSEFPPQQGWWLDISQQLVPKFQVLRSGKLVLTSASELVPGDIMYMCAGQQAVVDGRILVVAESGTTAVDVSHLTSRKDDVRVCSDESTGASAVESRNIILKDSHIVSGSLFCMVVRTPLEPFVSSCASSGLLDSECLINTTVPAPLSFSTCQNLFKNLCIRSNLFCRAFGILDCLRSTHFVVVMLTQALLEQGNVASFFAIITRLKKVPIFVVCNCVDGDVDQLCQKLGVQCTTFEDSSQSLNESSEIESAMFSLSLSTYPIGMGAVGDVESSTLTSLVSQLRSGVATAAVIRGISQAALLKLCHECADVENPMLYVMAEFHYPKCFRSLAVEGTRYPRSNNLSATGSLGPNGSISSYPSSAGGHNATPASRPNVSKISLSASVQDSARFPNSPNNAGVTKFNSESEITASKGTQGFSSMESTRTDPAPHINIGGQQQGGSRPDLDIITHVFVAVESIGIASAHSDCILLKPDLGCLGVGLELISKKLGRS